MLKKVIFNRAQLVRCARRAGKKRIDISQKEEEGGKISIGLYLNSYLPCHVNAKGPRYSSGSLGAPPGESFSNGLNKNNWPLMNGGPPSSCLIPRSDSPSLERRISNVVPSLSGMNYDLPNFSNLFMRKWFLRSILVRVSPYNFEGKISRRGFVPRLKLTFSFLSDKIERWR